METFGIFGFTFGMLGFLLGASATAKISRLEKRIEKLEGPAK